jgi:hypothetical protein
MYNVSIQVTPTVIEPNRRIVIEVGDCYLKGVDEHTLTKGSQ